MSFEKPQINAEIDALRSNTDLRDVAKALGYGLVTTDASLLTQGGAASYESLEDTIQEIHQHQSDFKVLRKIPENTVGQILHSWVEVYTIGQSRGGSISDDTGNFKEATRKGLRRFLRVKFQAQGWSVKQELIKQANFMDAMNQEDVAGLTRLEQDKTWMIYAGDSSIGDDQTDASPMGGHEFDGIDRIISNPAYYSYFKDGELTFDAFIEGSGLDGQGYSNPADIETGVERLAKRISQPYNGNGQTPDLYVGPTVRSFINAYQNFEPVQILDGTAQRKTKGAVIQAFVNLWTEQQYTSVHTDNYMPDSVNQWFLVPQLRGEAVAAPAPTVTATPGTAVDSAFKTGWDGNYVYAVAPFGKHLSKEGYEGAAVLSTAAAVAVNGKVTGTITAATGGKESGYLLYRGERNGDGTLANMRLIKRIPRTGGVTTFTDLNRELPNAHTAYLVEWGNAQVADLVSMYAPFRIELPRDREAPHTIPGMISATAALRTRRHRSIAKISNLIVPDGTGWVPQGIRA